MSCVVQWLNGLTKSKKVATGRICFTAKQQLKLRFPIHKSQANMHPLFTQVYTVNYLRTHCAYVSREVSVCRFSSKGLFLAFQVQNQLPRAFCADYYQQHSSMVWQGASTYLFRSTGQNSFVYVLVCKAHDFSTHAVLAAKMHNWRRVYVTQPFEKWHIQSKAACFLQVQC